MRWLAHLCSAGSGHCTVLLMKIQTGVLPGELQVIQQCASIGFKVAGRFLIADVKKATGETLAPGLHELSITCVVPGHFLLVVGVQVEEDFRGRIRYQCDP